MTTMKMKRLFVLVCSAAPCWSTLAPTSMPIPAPTKFPIPSPTKVPIPSPTKVPVPAPTMVPIPEPTQVPISAPTQVPIPPPTKVPIPSPTKVPVPAPSPQPTPVPSEPVFFGNNKFPSDIYPLVYTNAQAGTVFSDAELWSLKADDHWSEGQVWTLQVVASSTCASNGLAFGFAYDGGSHIVTVPPSANMVTLTVVDALKASFESTFFQARSVCSSPASGATVTFHAVEMARGDVTSPRPTRLPTTTPVPTSPVFFGTDAFPAGLAPKAYTNVQTGAVFTSLQLAPMKANPKWALGQVWTLQVVASSLCTSNALAFGLSADGGSHIFSVPASANRAHFTVVAPLKASFATNFFQARSKCTSPANPTVTFHSIAMAPGDVSTPFPSPQPTTTQHPTVTPTPLPTPEPTPMPTQEPTGVPAPAPTTVPIPTPTKAPIPAPTTMPVPVPTKVPVPAPTALPVPAPTKLPIPSPTSAPIPAPTSVPVPGPTNVPIPAPTKVPFPMPTPEPTPEPSPRPTPEPTPEPSPEPTPEPSPEPTPEPTPEPQKLK